MNTISASHENPSASPSRHFFRASAADFKKIPGSPIAYWSSSKILASFENPSLSTSASTRLGMATADNDKFLRLWHEVDQILIGYIFENREDASDSNAKWFPYQKGGVYRKWFGNMEYVVNWENDGNEIQNFIDEKSGKVRSHNYNLDFIFKKGVTWNALTSSKTSARITLHALFDNAGSSLFTNSSMEPEFVLGLINSSYMMAVFPLISPTLNFQPGDLSKVPFNKNLIADPEICYANIVNLISVSKSDWDNYETSWDFSDFPLLRTHGPWPFSDDRKESEIVFRSSENQAIKGKTLAESWENWKAFSQAMISRMKELEEENNRIWIEAYGLQDELSPGVPLKEITLTCNPWYRYSSDNKSEAQLWKLARADVARELISYAVGCMMGRYSLSKPGLILANQGEGVEEYWGRVGSGQWPVGSGQGKGVGSGQGPVDSGQGKGRQGSVKGVGSGQGPVVSGQEERRVQGELFSGHCPRTTAHYSFPPDSNGILPVLDGEWFADDVVARMREFLRVCWGKERLQENLHWLEEALGRDLRSYFLNDFYSNHISNDRAYGYKKRPIYWLFQSPKKGFGALVYLHRYNRDTVNTLLNGYLRPYLGKLSDRIKALDHELATASGSALTAARKEQESLRKNLKECQDWEREVLFPLAQKRIELDLDDGVKTNYPKFGKALATVPGVS